MCGITAVFVLFMRSLPKRRRRSLLGIELCTMFLLFADCLSYASNGKNTTFGFYGNRISNFLLFALTLGVLFAFNAYVINLYEDANKGIVPKRLKIVNYLGIAGEVMVVISQFTGSYYTFDSSNYYVRGPLYFISFLIPMTIFFLMESVIIQNIKKLSRAISISLLLFSTLPLVASVLQVKIYGLSFINTTIAGVGLLLYLFALMDMNETYAHANELKIEYLTTKEQSMRRLFEQTAEALGSAIDAKDKYQRGHSARVAAYSKTIAKMAGKDEKECEEVYYAALLHDIGNLGIKDEIINKKGKLTPKEYEDLKQHTRIGNEILSSIVEFPYLSIAANHHHERFDGRGYPDKLKGNDIPEFARIIAVADAYDAMTSRRSYREPLPRSKAREILVEEMGAQFDPVFAQQMVQMIDQDKELDIHEQTEVKEFAGNYEFDFDKYRTVFTEGILIAQNMKIRIHIQISPVEGHKEKECIPAVLLFDALDGRVHESGMLARELSYTEFAELWFDGTNKIGKARAVRPNVMRLKAAISEAVSAGRNCGEYDMEIVRQKDHVLIKIIGETKIVEYIVALPDATRFSYISFTGEYYHLFVSSIKRHENAVPDDYIPRIAKMVTYVDGPEGDIPNVQVDGFRTDTTNGILLGDKMELDFHTMSLPTARLIWHCPFISFFNSSGGLVKDEDYHEFALIRLDGEVWESGTLATTEVILSKDDSFESWEKWKKINKEGFDCHVSITRSGRTVTMITKNGGIFLKTITKMKTDDDIYVALTGDQIALTKIYVKQ